MHSLGGFDSYVSTFVQNGKLFSDVHMGNTLDATYSGFAEHRKRGVIFQPDAWYLPGSTSFRYSRKGLTENE